MRRFNHEPSRTFTNKGKVLFLMFAGFLALSSCTNPFMERLFSSEKVSYTVKFDSNGGSPVPSQKVAKGGKATRPDNPTKDEDGTEYGFVNWYDNEELAEPHYNFNTPVSANITLYAKWSDTVYTVTFDSNGGSAVPSQRVGEDGTASRPSHDPSRSGYTFGGWYIDEDCTEAYDFETPVTDDITLYAKWTGNTAIITITLEQMTDLSGDDIDGGIIYRNDTPTSVNLEYTDTGSYTCEWSIDGVGDYAGTTVTGSGPSFTVDANNEKYNSLGRHAVYLTVVKNGVPYRKTIWVEIVDFEPVPATGVTLSPTSLSLVVGSTGTLSADFEPDNATNRNVTWSSNNDAVATVTGGVVSAVSVGNATITVTTEDGDHTASCAVKVSATPILVSDLTLNKTTLALAVGGTETLRATVAPTDATDKAVNWSISPSGIARVTNGSVTAIGAGSATVTVTTADGNRTASCAVTVTASSVLNDIDFGPGATVTTLSVNSTTTWNTARTTIRNGGDDKNYVINVTADFTVSGYTSGTFGTATGIKISLRGANRTVSLSSTSSWYLIAIGADQTVILRDLTLKGRSSNDHAVVHVNGGSAFIMQSGKISGNTNSGYGGAGVYVGTDGTFTMLGGTISGNTVSGNDSGGGVYVFSSTFTMHGGTISGNKTGGGGGGVSTSQKTSLFTMYGGEISGNTTTSTIDIYGGGGVSASGTFTMHGGIISGNKASSTGGGVITTGTFRLVNGTIYGSNATPTNLRNTATKGAAFYKYINTAQHGTFAANGTWVSSGDLATTNDTIRVVEGEYE